uniref:Uncharacterized protein LOC116941465 n=1 Tax=Petromyzon marinus TaxID=7757 RepID=A0AAJ7T144_PETMA|nr:uncharacterized protein LOC116941465 [Petromyzon marinus]
MLLQRAYDVQAARIRDAQDLHEDPDGATERPDGGQHPGRLHAVLSRLRTARHHGLKVRGPEGPARDPNANGGNGGIGGGSCCRGQRAALAPVRQQQQQLQQLLLRHRSPTLPLALPVLASRQTAAPQSPMNADFQSQPHSQSQLQPYPQLDSQPQLPLHAHAQVQCQHVGPSPMQPSPQLHFHTQQQQQQQQQQLQQPHHPHARLLPRPQLPATAPAISSGARWPFLTHSPDAAAAASVSSHGGASEPSYGAPSCWRRAAGTSVDGQRGRPDAIARTRVSSNAACEMRRQAEAEWAGCAGREPSAVPPAAVPPAAAITLNLADGAGVDPATRAPWAVVPRTSAAATAVVQTPCEGPPWGSRGAVRPEGRPPVGPSLPAPHRCSQVGYQPISIVDLTKENGSSYHDQLATFPNTSSLSSSSSSTAATPTPCRQGLQLPPLLTPRLPPSVPDPASPKEGGLLESPTKHDRLLDEVRGFVRAAAAQGDESSALRLRRYEREVLRATRDGRADRSPPSTPLPQGGGQQERLRHGRRGGSPPDRRGGETRPQAAAARRQDALRGADDRSRSRSPERARETLRDDPEHFAKCRRRERRLDGQDESQPRHDCVQDHHQDLDFHQDEFQACLDRQQVITWDAYQDGRQDRCHPTDENAFQQARTDGGAVCREVTVSGAAISKRIDPDSDGMLGGSQASELSNDQHAGNFHAAGPFVEPTAEENVTAESCVSRPVNVTTVATSEGAADADQTTEAQRSGAENSPAGGREHRRRIGDDGDDDDDNGRPQPSGPAIDRPGAHATVKRSFSYPVTERDVQTECDIVFVSEMLAEEEARWSGATQGPAARRTARKSTRGHVSNEEFWELQTRRLTATDWKPAARQTRPHGSVATAADAAVSEQLRIQGDVVAKFGHMHTKMTAPHFSKKCLVTLTRNIDSLVSRGRSSTVVEGCTTTKSAWKLRSKGGPGKIPSVVEKLKRRGSPSRLPSRHRLVVALWDPTKGPDVESMAPRNASLKEWMGLQFTRVKSEHDDGWSSGSAEATRKPHAVQPADDDDGCGDVKPPLLLIEQEEMNAMKGASHGLVGNVDEKHANCDPNMGGHAVMKSEICVADCLNELEFDEDDNIVYSDEPPLKQRIKQEPDDREKTPTVPARVLQHASSAGSVPGARESKTSGTARRRAPPAGSRDSELAATGVGVRSRRKRDAPRSGPRDGAARGENSGGGSPSRDRDDDQADGCRRGTGPLEPSVLAEAPAPQHRNSGTAAPSLRLLEHSRAGPDAGRASAPAARDSSAASTGEERGNRRAAAIAGRRAASGTVGAPASKRAEVRRRVQKERADRSRGHRRTACRADASDRSVGPDGTRAAGGETAAAAPASRLVVERPFAASAFGLDAGPGGGRSSPAGGPAWGQRDAGLLRCGQLRGLRPCQLEWVEQQYARLNVGWVAPAPGFAAIPRTDCPRVAMQVARRDEPEARDTSLVRELFGRSVRPEEVRRLFVEESAETAIATYGGVVAEVPTGDERQGGPAGGEGFSGSASVRVICRVGIRSRGKPKKKKKKGVERGARHRKRRRAVARPAKPALKTDRARNPPRWDASRSTLEGRVEALCVDSPDERTNSSPIYVIENSYGIDEVDGYPVEMPDFAYDGEADTSEASAADGAVVGNGAPPSQEPAASPSAGPCHGDSTPQDGGVEPPRDTVDAVPDRDRGSDSGDSATFPSGVCGVPDVAAPRPPVTDDARAPGDGENGFVLEGDISPGVGLGREADEAIPPGAPAFCCTVAERCPSGPPVCDVTTGLGGARVGAGSEAATAETRRHADVADSKPPFHPAVEITWVGNGAGGAANAGADVGTLLPRLDVSARISGAMGTAGPCADIGSPLFWNAVDFISGPLMPTARGGRLDASGDSAFPSEALADGEVPTLDGPEWNELAGAGGRRPLASADRSAFGDGGDNPAGRAAGSGVADGRAPLGARQPPLPAVALAAAGESCIEFPKDYVYMPEGGSLARPDGAESSTMGARSIPYPSLYRVPPSLL